MINIEKLTRAEAIKLCKERGLELKKIKSELNLTKKRYNSLLSKNTQTNLENRRMVNHLRLIRDRIDYLIAHNGTQNKGTPKKGETGIKLANVKSNKTAQYLKSIKNGQKNNRLLSKKEP